jgi:hypothetical protein
MTHEEIVKLCRYIQAACPAQRFDEYTPDVWAEVFPASLTLDDCRAAVITIKQRQRYIDPSDIIAEVRRIRSNRLDRTLIEAPSAELCGSPGDYKAELIRQTTAIASGLDLNRELRALPSGKP